MKNEISISTEYIKLDQLLKLAGAIGTGGEGKIIIKSGQVKVNDEIVLERGKKVKKGDKVEIIGGETLIIK